MEFDIEKIVGNECFYCVKEKKDGKEREAYKTGEKGEEGAGRAFLIVNKNTIEVRTDEQLGKLLQEKYESVMESRYFGKGGIEIVTSGQLSESEVEDLIRLSYNLSK